ncbi:hypothetical protein C8F01DRAFT_1077184 [Mycena amicta]|nr:hypothetical protein C8F01DRAFT_1077184 [Mycena amicta]
MTLSNLPSQSSLDEKIVVLQHLSAVEFLSAAYATLCRHELSANIVLAHALSRVPAEYVLTECQFPNESEIQPTTTTLPVAAENFWLTVHVSSQSSSSKPVLEVVVSCLSSSMGTYPIFLWGSTLPRRTSAVVSFLQGCLDPKRVFAVFGPTGLADAFAQSWTLLTDFHIRQEPLYDALFASCSPQALTPVASSRSIRKATHMDIDAVARLCEEFSNGSSYPLDAFQAKVEAAELVEKGLIWVCETTTKEIATICAVTRSSLRVSAITKVCTLPEWRCHGFAQDLVHEFSWQPNTHSRVV